MTSNGWRCVASGFLAFIVGPLFGILLGKAGIIFGTAGVALFLAGRMGAKERFALTSAYAGMFAMVGPALAAGLPARWVAEALLYNRYINGWEQMKVSAFVFVLFMAVGAIAGMVGGAFRRAPSL